VRYLYVDQRWADGIPQYSASPNVGYFYDGETPERRNLTRAQLTKFDDVSGIEVAYRHGPVAIYDLSGLGAPERRSGWIGEARSLDVPTQLVIGILIGLVFGLFGRSKSASVAMRVVRSFKTAAGPALTFAAVVAALCAASVVLLLVHIWFAPTIFVAIVLTWLAVDRHGARWAVTVLRDQTARLHRWPIAAVAGVVALVAVAIARSVLDAYVVDIRGVQAVLEDPSTVYVRAQDLTTSADHWKLK
jgi:hypothetical protein